MRKALLSLAFIGASTAVACSFEMKTGNQPQTPNQAASPPPQNAPPPAQPSATGTNLAAAAKTHAGSHKFPAPMPHSTSTATPTATAAPTAPQPAGVAVVSGTTAFGSGSPDPTGWKGTISWIPAGTKKLPDMNAQPAAGYVFIKQLDIPVRPFTDGFPGVDATKKENFAIRYEAPLVVNTEGDYEFKLAADDGAVLAIDNTPIVDNDGSHDFTPKTGPVHLVRGTHMMRVDYFQTTGNVGLQLFCKKIGDPSDKICPTSL